MFAPRVSTDGNSRVEMQVTSVEAINVRDIFEYYTQCIIYPGKYRDTGMDKSTQCTQNGL